MQTAPETISTSRGSLWAGRILSGLAVLFLLFDAVIKVLKMPFAVDATVQLGYPGSLVLTIGVIELICTVLYVIPSTSILGVVLLTGYLGGRHGDSRSITHPPSRLVYRSRSCSRLGRPCQNSMASGFTR